MRVNILINMLDFFCGKKTRRGINNHLWVKDRRKKYKFLLFEELLTFWFRYFERKSDNDKRRKVCQSKYSQSVEFLI